MNPSDEADELIKILGLERDLLDQLVLSNYEDVQSNWTFTVEKLLAWNRQQVAVAVRAANISQIKNWRDWIGNDLNEDLKWLIEAMDSAIKSLEDTELTDENGVYREALRFTTDSEAGK